LLASKGFTLNPESGEISDLAHLNTALSKRSAQIEGNRARKIAEWKAEHGGQEPSVEALTVIDRWAWAQDRPDKPSGLDEADWEARVRDQIAGLDPSAGAARAPVAPPRAPTTASRKQVAEAAQVAVRIADQRALRHGGRVSAWDIRAAAADGLLAVLPTFAREAFTVVQQQVIAAAHEHVTNLTDTHPETVPAGAKVFIADSTWRAREHLNRLAAQLTQPGVRAAVATVLAHCDPAVKLDASQVAAACMIAGTDRAVVIIGAAGAGKTTMLKPAVAALAAQGRRTVIVAPSRKAAAFAGREVGADATSVDMLLIQHGLHPPNTRRWHRRLGLPPKAGRPERCVPSVAAGRSDRGGRGGHARHPQGRRARGSRQPYRGRPYAGERVGQRRDVRGDAEASAQRGRHDAALVVRLSEERRGATASATVEVPPGQRLREREAAVGVLHDLVGPAAPAGLPGDGAFAVDRETRAAHRGDPRRGGGELGRRIAEIGGLVAVVAASVVQADALTGRLQMQVDHALNRHGRQGFPH